MIKINSLSIPLKHNENTVKTAAAKAIGQSADSITKIIILKKSIDARKKNNIHYVMTVAAEVKNENAILKKCKNIEKYIYYSPLSVPKSRLSTRPVVVGFGPAGIFAALILAEAGARPIVLERGEDVDSRKKKTDLFWQSGILDEECNVQFGEGGAGAFSDGKLNTGTRDPRHRFILEQLVSCGAPPDILIDAKPHVGTDYLHIVLKNLRRELLRLGADIRFETRLADLDIRQGRLAGIAAEGPAGAYSLPCSRLALCPGHSARDTFAMLHARGLSMEAKPFAVGVRVEHRQADCDAAQYKRYAGHPGLPASSYKLFCHLSGGRSVFSFCVCPGGEVVAAASEERQVVTNGMSEFARSRANINGALLVNVTPEDFGGNSPLAGIEFQRRLERAAYDLGGGGYRAPAQRIEDFLAGRPSAGPGRVIPSYRPGVVWTDLRQCLPPFVSDAIAEALPILGRKLRGYDAPDAVLTAVESRSSSPVRIPRDETCQSSLPGLYPCGEGAGYAGGILSAAADGMRCAEQICESL